MNLRELEKVAWEIIPALPPCGAVEAEAAMAVMVAMPLQAEAEAVAMAVMAVMEAVLAAEAAATVVMVAMAHQAAAEAAVMEQAEKAEMGARLVCREKMEDMQLAVEVAVIVLVKTILVPQVQEAMVS